jgi:hypothetical protein
MQISADLRAQQTAYKGRTDPGHANSQYTAQLVANGIRNSQAMIASINRQPCNSGSYQQDYQQQTCQQQTYQQQKQFHESQINSLDYEEQQLRFQIQNAKGGRHQDELQNKLDHNRYKKDLLERQMGR